MTRDSLGSRRELPAPKEVRDLLEDLFGREVGIGVGEPFRAGDLSKLLLVCLYVDDVMTLKVVVGMDLPMTVYAGAAIGLIPALAAAECIEERKLTPMIAENVTEVCNILGTVLNRPGAPHVRLFQTFLPGEMPPPDAIGYLLAFGRRLDLNVNVQGYGVGRLAITLAN